MQFLLNFRQNGICRLWFFMINLDTKKKKVKNLKIESGSRQNLKNRVIETVSVIASATLLSESVNGVIAAKKEVGLEGVIGAESGIERVKGLENGHVNVVDGLKSAEKMKKSSSSEDVSSEK